jgi:putative transcriptional regulator
MPCLEGSLAGRLLIGSPATEDPRFSRAVILVCTHNEDHAMGIVLNKPSDEGPLSELLDQLGVCLTATRDVLHAITSEEPPEHFVLALGYSGWGAGPLELELAENVWLVGEPDIALVCDPSRDTKWSRALTRIGVSSDTLQVSGGRAWALSVTNASTLLQTGPASCPLRAHSETPHAHRSPCRRPAVRPCRPGADRLRPSREA